MQMQWIQFLVEQCENSSPLWAVTVTSSCFLESLQRAQMATDLGEVFSANNKEPTQFPFNDSIHSISSSNISP